MDRSSDNTLDVDIMSDHLMFTSLQNRLHTRSVMTFTEILRIRRFRSGVNSIFLSGSRAEFCMEPMVKYFDDVDIMIAHKNILAFADTYPTISGAIRGFDEFVECVKITSTTEFPGYCHLKLAGAILFHWQSESFIPLYSINTEVYLRKAKEHYEHEIDVESRIAYVMNEFKKEIFKTQLYSTEIDHAVNGPALCRKFNASEVTGKHEIHEIVHCIWCPQWPREAAEWVSRPRKYGWPTQAIIRRIVDNGCHFVKVCHPDCPKDQAELQFRFSFSHAEVILIRSWTPIQQVVYHILRYFAKMELIKKDCPKEDEILKGYHLKTTMLWTSEKKPIDWWKSAPVLVTLSKIMKTLLKWLRKEYIANYFLPRTNLLRRNLHRKNFKTVLHKMEQFSNVVNLNGWFLKNYTRTHFQKGFGTVCMRIEVSDLEIFHALLAYSRFRENIANFDIRFMVDTENVLKFALFLRKKGIDWKLQQLINVPNHSVSEICSEIGATMLLGMMSATSSQNTAKQFVSLQVTVVLLHAEYLVSAEEMAFDNELVTDMIRGIPMESKSICVRSHNFPHRPTYRLKLQQSHVLLLRAQEVLETITTAARDPQFQVLSRITLAILKQCLETRDSKSECVRCAALVYIAALLHVDHDCRFTVELCSLAKQSCQKNGFFRIVRTGNVKPLNAFCLLFFDDVARLAGFFMLFRKFEFGLCIKKQLHHLLRITPEIFVEYLIALAAGTSHRFSFDLWRLNISKLFVMDFLLLTLIKSRQRLSNSWQKHNLCRSSYNMPHCIYLRANSVATKKAINRIKLKTNIDTTTNMLFQWCLGELELFAKVVSEKYGIVYDATECYRALFLYKCSRYTDVRQVCHKILLEMDLCDRSPEMSMKDIVVFPPFDGFFDKEIQCLVGLQTLCYFCLPLEAKRKLRFTWFENKIRTDVATAIQAGYALVFAPPAAVIFLYVLRKDFVAQYLLLKTAIALGEPRFSICSAYYRINSVLPFETVIHMFWFQQIRRKGWEITHQNSD